MTKSNLTRNCTSFVSCYINYKFQPNIVKYSNVGLLIKWWQLYKTINLVSIWDKNDFSRTFQEQQPKYGVFQEQFQNQKNSRTIQRIQGIHEQVATLLVVMKNYGNLRVMSVTWNIRVVMTFNIAVSMVRYSGSHTNIFYWIFSLHFKKLGQGGLSLRNFL